MFRRASADRSGARDRALVLIGATCSGTLEPRRVFAGAHQLLAADVCWIIPDDEAHRTPVEPPLVRRRIAQDRPGVPLALRLQVIDAGYVPVRRARLDLWHWDAAGANPGSAGDADLPADRALRGTQFADADGIAEFETIYPGRDRGRSACIHVRAHIDEETVLTGRIVLCDVLSAFLAEHVAVYRGAEPASSHDRMASRASEDRTGREQGDSLATAEGLGEAYLAQLILGVDPRRPYRQH